MNVVIAIDSLKGSLTSLEAGQMIREGIHRVYPEADVQVRPLADGGEGTTEALTAGMGGTFREVTVTGPLGMPVAATYGILPDHQTCIMEMASAAGLPLVPKDRRNPLKTTTYGLGEMIREGRTIGSSFIRQHKMQKTNPAPFGPACRQPGAGFFIVLRSETGTFDFHARKAWGQHKPE